jgi:murein DD-endopeptidase MepM/ murein hydrolase activator NlpD
VLTFHFRHLEPIWPAIDLAGVPGVFFRSRTGRFISAGRAAGSRVPEDRILKQDYFILVLAHSLHGRLQRIHISHRWLYGVAGAVGLICLLALGVIGSYARMALKAANYNSLQREAQLLRERYGNLQKKVKETNEQLASLQMLADEVTVAYGIRKQIAGTSDLVAEAPLIPAMGETLAEYNFLRSTNLAGRNRNIFVRGHLNVLPSMWPVNGRLMDGFGHRADPFSGEGAMHTGVDISAPFGAAVRGTADGIVVHASWYAGYGRAVIVDHGNGYQTLYGHLSKVVAIEGQEIRQGEIIGLVGSSGRSTGAHLHYEVRVHSTPVNPYRFLARTTTMQAATRTDFPF